MNKTQRVLALAVLLLSTAAQEARAGWLVGSSYQLDFTNFPVDASTTTTLDLTTKTVNTNLTVGEQIFQDGPNSQWIDFNFQSINGGPLASDLNATWQINVNGVQVAQPALGSGFYFYWTVNGAPVTPIFPFGGFGGVAPIPTDPSLGPAYVVVGFPPYGPLDSFDAFAFSSPYSFIGAGGMNRQQSTVSTSESGRRTYNPSPSQPASRCSAWEFRPYFGTPGVVVAKVRRTAHDLRPRRPRPQSDTQSERGAQPCQRPPSRPTPIRPPISSPTSAAARSTGPWPT